jgi:hypothetical protein
MTSVPQVTLKSHTVEPSVMRRLEASIDGQLRATVPLVGMTASTRVEGEKFDVELDVEVDVAALAVTVTVVAAAVVVALHYYQFRNS